MFFLSFASLGVNLPVYLSFTYFMAYKVIPQTLLKRKTGSFILFLFFLSLLFSILLRVITKYIFHLYISDYDYSQIRIFDLYPLSANMVWINVPLFMFLGVKYVSNYSLEISRKKELEKQNLQAELSLLLIQLQPHFLFNTLNNLYSMSVSGDKRIVDGLSKIINMLKYILFECGEERVSLDREISLIKDYIELEKIRYHERLNFQFQTNVKNSSLKIVPMIFFTFVENSFKHGSSPEAGKSFIHLFLEEENGRLFFRAENSYPGKKDETGGKGLGLENVKKRLDLYYPERYKLEINEEEQVFRVCLTLNL